MSNELDLDDYQERLHAWARSAFGDEHVASLAQRALRLLEESIELAQAAGVSKDLARKLVDFVYARPPGTVREELGGVAVTALVFAESAMFSFGGVLIEEAKRVLAKPIEHFTRRNQAKGDAGFNIVPGKRPPTNLDGGET